MSTDPIYEIYALNYGGPVERPQSFMRWLGDFSIMEKGSYFIWILKPAQGDGPVIMVDAGLTVERAAQAGTPNHVDPVQVLAGLDLSPEDIEHIILTHLHFDHTSGIELFPKAKIYAQKTEFEFWIKNPLSFKPALAQLKDEKSLNLLAEMEGTDRLVLVDGDQTVLPGVKCLLAPGHTPGLQAVAVQTSQGRAALGSDCGHTFSNYADCWPSCLIFDLPAWLESMDRLKNEVSKPELLFPGHDPLMASNYPQIAPGVTRLA